jgi:heme-degrading monooxygenase HmoA
MVVIVQHRVRDYDAWKAVFDEHGDVRRRHGATGHELYRGLDDPNEVTVVNHFPSREAGEAFAADPSL